MRPLTIDSACIFYPRGGSAQVIRYLLKEFNQRGSTTRLHAGSLGPAGHPGHAPSFYQDLDLHPYDYNPAHEQWAKGVNAQELRDHPFHPSYEDRSQPDVGCPDPMFAATSTIGAARLSAAWHTHLTEHRTPGTVDVLHLHHLSYLQDAAARAYPHVPVVTTLHGTELKQLSGMLERLALAQRLDTSVADLADYFPLKRPHRPQAIDRLAARHGLSEAEHQLLTTTDWPQWRNSMYWHQALRYAAAKAGQIVTVSEHDRDLARQLLPSLVGREVPVITNGADTSRFHPAQPSDGQRLDNLRRWLVTDPQGWDESGQPGSIRYTEADLARLTDPDTGRLRPLILWSGRFLDFKRVPVMLEGFAKAREQLPVAPVLLMWGGYPGEFEGRHPAAVAAELGITESVFFIGWRGHNDLPTGLQTADLMAAPAVNEPFGMVYVEAMACGTPPVATATGGPAQIITPAGPTANGWLVKPDSSDALAQALVAALSDDHERRRRAATAARHAREVYSWARVADRYTEVYEKAISRASAFR